MVMDHLIGDEENIQFVGLFLDGLSPQVQKAAQKPLLYTEERRPMEWCNSGGSAPA